MLEWALEHSDAPKQKRKTQFDLLIEFFTANNINLIKNQDDKGCLQVPILDGGHDVFVINSKRGKLFVRRVLYEQFKSSPRSNDLSDLVNTLDSIAIFEGEHHEFKLRVAWEGEDVVVDIGDEKRSIIICTKDGWTVGYSSQVMFLRREGYRALPTPTKGGNLEGLRNLLGIREDHVWHCFLAFILNVFRPDGPYFSLMIDGEQGSGKSFLSTVIKRITDPNQVEKLRFPRSDRDLMIQASKFFLIIFDNASGVKQALSNTLCSIATGGGFATRMLHTDDDLMIFNVCRPFIINGIGGFAYNPDLLERGIHMSLSAMDPDKRKTEKELNAALEAMLPGVLGVFMDAVVMALKNHSTTATPKGIRMSDAAKWVAAAEPAFGLVEGTFVNAMRQSQNETMGRVAIDSALGQGIIKLLKKSDGQFSGGHAELLQALIDVGANESRDPFFPTSSSRLSSELSKLSPALKKAGIVVEKLPRQNTGSRIQIRFDGTVDYHEDDAPNREF
ncbi:hypothetical protein [Algimonas arctica]|nr:hypothetical protein [Algimonas arctica]